jgi:hypothetical protein
MLDKRAVISAPLFGRGQPPLCDQRSDTIVSGRSPSGNDVRYRATAKRDADLFAAFDGPQSLAQRPFEFANTNLAHVVTRPHGLIESGSSRLFMRITRFG